MGNIADATARVKYPNWTTITGNDGYIYTAPAGRFRANAFGLFDMHGNVWEWCWDGYKADYYKEAPGDDPSGPFEASSRVIRGGGWCNFARSGRSADRDGAAPDARDFYLGFRVARVRSGQ